MEPTYGYILKVYEKGSFSKAAKALFLTQPALSMAIQRVEQEIGMPLFDRSKRPLEPTEAGRAFIHMAMEMESLEQDLQSRVQDLKDLKSGRLKVGGSHYLNACILPPALTDFRQLYPGIALELVEDSSAALAEMINRRTLDLTFSCSSRFEDAERYPAFFDNVLLAVPAAHPVNAPLAPVALTAGDVLAGRHLEPACPAVDIRELAELELILLKPGNDLYTRSIGYFERRGLSPRVALTVDQLATASALAASGYAAAFVSDRLITASDGRLLFYKLDDPEARRLFYAILPSRRYTSRSVHAFIRVLLSHLS